MVLTSRLYYSYIRVYYRMGLGCGSWKIHTTRTTSHQSRAISPLINSLGSKHSIRPTRLMRWVVVEIYALGGGCWRCCLMFVVALNTLCVVLRRELPNYGGRPFITRLLVITNRLLLLLCGGQYAHK